MESVAGAATTTPDDARASLAEVAGDRRHLGAVVRREARWYAPVYGLVVGGLVLTLAGPMATLTPRVLGGIVALGVLAGTYRLRTGMWPRGGTATHEAARVAVTLLVVGTMLMEWGAWHVWGLQGLGVGLAVVAGAAAGALSYVYDAATARALEQP